MIPYDSKAPLILPDKGACNQNTSLNCNAAIGYKEQSVFVVKKLSAAKYPQVSGLLVPLQKDILNDIRNEREITSYKIACNHDIDVLQAREMIGDLIRRKLVRCFIIGRTTVYAPVVL